jgi:DNA modification methylase
VDGKAMIICGDALVELRKLPDESVNCCVTSPPYWGLRDYGVPGQLGLEKTPEEYVARMVEVFREVRRALRKDGTLWLNLGDSYAAARSYQVRQSLQGEYTIGERYNSQSVHVPPGLKPKDLVGIPWRVAFALQADGWVLRQEIIWQKPNPMPESVRDRCTKSHEQIFMFAKARRYWYDAEAVKEAATSSYRPSDFIPKSEKDKQGQSCATKASPNNRTDEIKNTDRNLRSVWTITTKPFPEAHFATFPPEIPERCIKAGCPKGGVVLDPFFGAGTTGLVAMRLGREFIGIELNADYCKMAGRRIYGTLIPEARP